MSDVLKNMGMLRGPIAIPVDPTLIGKIICGEGFNPKEMPSREDALKNFFCSMVDSCQQGDESVNEACCDEECNEECNTCCCDGCGEGCCNDDYCNDDFNYETYANDEIEDDPEFAESFFSIKNCTNGCTKSATETKCSDENNTEDKNDGLSVALHSEIVETLEEKTAFINYVSELTKSIVRTQGVKVIVNVVPLKDGDGNHRILEGCEDVFLGLLKANRPKSELIGFLAAECSVIVKIK